MNFLQSSDDNLDDDDGPPLEGLEIDVLLDHLGLSGLNVSVNLALLRALVVLPVLTDDILAVLPNDRAVVNEIEATILPDDGDSRNNKDRKKE